jgi:hypothetical protein
MPTRKSTRARGVARLSGVPLPLVGKSNWSPSMPHSSVSAARSAARAPSMVRSPSVRPNRLRLRLAPRLRLTLRISRAVSEYGTDS